VAGAIATGSCHATQGAVAAEGERAIARLHAPSPPQGLWAAAGETGPGRIPSAVAKARMLRLPWSDRAMLADGGYLAAGAGGTSSARRRTMPCDAAFLFSVVRGRNGPPHRSGFSEGDGVIEVEAGALIGDLVAAVAHACASA
jgi:hypothetical protein